MITPQLRTYFSSLAFQKTSKSPTDWFVNLDLSGLLRRLHSDSLLNLTPLSHSNFLLHPLTPLHLTSLYHLTPPSLHSTHSTLSLFHSTPSFSDSPTLIPSLHSVMSLPCTPVNPYISLHSPSRLFTPLHSLTPLYSHSFTPFLRSTLLHFTPLHFHSFNRSPL